jgi:hypothetical protein
MQAADTAEGRISLRVGQEHSARQQEESGILAGDAAFLFTMVREGDKSTVAPSLLGHEILRQCLPLRAVSPP